jgi:hypothetical protein
VRSRDPMVALVAALFVTTAAAATPPITAERVEAAVKEVREDPKLGSQRTERRLRWKADDDVPKPDEKAPPASSPSPWLVDFIAWLAQAGRLLVWLLGAVAVAALALGLRHWIRVRAESASNRPVELPSHVRELDIRPQSLPADIGGAARALWLQGDPRGAMSLLYRGALSRLVHEHGVAIRSSSTEGECVALARRLRRAAAADYVERLVEAWLLAVYGARIPDAQIVFALCDRFDACLSTTPMALTQREAA